MPVFVDPFGSVRHGGPRQLGGIMTGRYVGYFVGEAAGRLRGMTEPDPQRRSSNDDADPNVTPAEAPDGEPSNEDQAGEDPSPTPHAIRPRGIELARTLATGAARVALDNRGMDVVVLDVTRQSAEFDLFVLATGQSRRQLHAISEQIDDELEKHLGDRRLGIEGYDESRWIVLDYGNVVVHLFDEETREYYDLESLWADATEVPLESLGLPPSPRTDTGEETPS